MSREYNAEGVRTIFIDHVRAMVDYRAALDMPEREKLEGLDFSILVALDGEAAAVPALIVAPCPHPDDKQNTTLRTVKITTPRTIVRKFGVTSQVRYTSYSVAEPRRE